MTAKTFTAKYRDAAGIVREVATGCRDEMAARAVLAEHLRRNELVRSGVVSAVEDQISDHVHAPLETHREDYLAHLRAKGAIERHVKNFEGLLKRLSNDCNFKRLADQLKIHRGADMDKLAAELKPETRIEAERIGRERGLIYRTLGMTGGSFVLSRADKWNSKAMPRESSFAQPMRRTAKRRRYRYGRTRRRNCNRGWMRA